MMKSPNLKILFFILLFVTINGYSQHNRFSKLDTLFDYLYENQKIMGSIAVLKNNKLIYENQVGYLNIEEKIKADVHTKYRIGSVTKVFTATLIFQLIDDGKLTLDTKLSKFYPQLPNANKITIANLLNHSSGLFNITNDADFRTWMVIPNTRTQMVERIAKHDANFKPGEKNAYSNTNYLLLGYIIEKIEGKPYASVLEERIIKKINLKHTYYGGKINNKSNESSSYSYESNGLELAKETDMSVPHGAGAIVSTPSDLAHFSRALFEGKLLKDQTLDYMMTTNKNGFGSGIFKIEQGGRELYNHNGGIDGFKSLLVYIPKSKVSIAISTNALDYGLVPIVTKIIKAVFNEDFDMPKFKFDTIEITTQQAKQYEGIYKSDKVPYNLIFTVDGNVLKGAPEGNTPMALTPIKEHEFILNKIGIHLLFKPASSILMFKQPGSEPILFNKINQ